MVPKIAKINVSYGLTVNLGNYESRRLDISLEKDIYLKNFEQEVTATFQHLKYKINEILESL